MWETLRAVKLCHAKNMNEISTFAPPQAMEDGLKYVSW